MANLFDLNWDKIDYQNISEENYQLLDNEIQSVFDSYMQSTSNHDSDSFELFLFYLFKINKLKIFLELIILTIIYKWFMKLLMIDLKLLVIRWKA